MALSSDEVIKREIIDTLVNSSSSLRLRVFPEGSNDDQKLFEEGGLTFRAAGVDYGSCYACWVVRQRHRIREGIEVPVIALEGTDALNRRSSGNA